TQWRLHLDRLLIAGTEIVTHRVAKDVPLGFLLGNISSLFSDNACKLELEVDDLRIPRPLGCGSRTYDRETVALVIKRPVEKELRHLERAPCRELCEGLRWVRRALRNFLEHHLGAAHAVLFECRETANLLRPGERCQELHLLQCGDLRRR